MKYMDSKVVFGFIRTGVKYMDSKVDFWFYSYWGGGGGGGKMCRSTMHRRGRDKMCVSTTRRNLHKLTKIFNDVLSKYHISSNKRPGRLF